MNIEILLGFVWLWSAAAAEKAVLDPGLKLVLEASEKGERRKLEQSCAALNRVYRLWPNEMIE